MADTVVDLVLVLPVACDGLAWGGQAGSRALSRVQIEIKILGSKLGRTVVEPAATVPFPDSVTVVNGPLGELAQGAHTDPVGPSDCSSFLVLSAHLAVCVAVTVPLTVVPCARQILSTSLTASAGA